MMYGSVGQILRVHFLLGLGLGVMVAVYAAYKERPRKWLAFGGETFSLGEHRLWLRWYVIASVFELVTSMGPAHVFYTEVALSFVEAAALTLGAFTVDRAVRLVWESEGPSPSERTQTRQTFYDDFRARRAQKEADKKAAEETARARFDEATKGH